MSGTRECPLCGGTMKFRRVDAVIRIPGSAKTTVRPAGEWICPDCDYFEEAEEEKT